MNDWSIVPATLPVLTALASAFYAALAAIVVLAPFRRWLLARLVMPTPSNQPKLAVLDTFRGLAALWVAAFHFWQWTHPTFDGARLLFAPLVKGDKAVPIFVVLSGFLIWKALLAAVSIDGLRRYAVNRALRLFPLYAAVTLVAFVSGRAGGGGIRSLVADLLLARTFAASQFVMPQNWSLYVEIAFYLMAPVIMIALGRRALPVATLLLGGLVLSELPGFPREFGIVKYFVIGIIACELHVLFGQRIRPAMAAALFAAGIGVLYLDIVTGIDLVFSVFPHIYPAGPALTLGLGLGFALLMLGAIHSPVLSRALSVPPLQILGTLSYGVFLWHGLLMTVDLPLRFSGSGGFGTASGPWPAAALPAATLFLVVLPGLVFVSGLSFLAIERPFLLLRKRLGR
jgi:peptidoglycan/LPS O-acetylase OafA/YrhL